MDVHFRDTVFGQVVRLISRNRLLNFPDELDQSLWKQCVRTDSAAASSTAKAHVVKDAEKPQQGSRMDSPSGSGDTQVLPDGQPCYHQTTIVHLVDWYGPDDPEV